MEYRGISFSPRAYGILNHTGPSEGVAIPVGMDKYDTPTIFDSMLAQPVKVAFTGAVGCQRAARRHACVWSRRLGRQPAALRGTGDLGTRAAPELLPTRVWISVQARTCE